ncbi:PIG-L family deacetylase [Candidatus Woesearchaeota archaeon]|nr:PIG-L family deacetylase [Candidatus Woesearchaeota archaeon]
MTETILCVVAHNDDYIVHAGGTLAKYASKGKRIITVVCSYGGLSHLKREILIKRKERESQHANKIIGGMDVIFLEQQKFKDHTILKKLTNIIKQEKPNMIFTHANSILPSHRAVHRMIQDLIDNQLVTCPVYTFNKTFNKTQLVVGTTKTFPTKIQAYMAYKHKLLQGMTLWAMFIKDKYTGWLNNRKYAEVFSRMN